MDRRFTTGKVYYGAKFAKMLQAPAPSIIDRWQSRWEEVPEPIAWFFIGLLCVAFILGALIGAR